MRSAELLTRTVCVHLLTDFLMCRVLCGNIQMDFFNLEKSISDLRWPLGYILLKAIKKRKTFQWFSLQHLRENEQFFIPNINYHWRKGKSNRWESQSVAKYLSSISSKNNKFFFLLFRGVFRLAMMSNFRLCLDRTLMIVYGRKQISVFSVARSEVRYLIGILDRTSMALEQIRQ